MQEQRKRDAKERERNAMTQALVPAGYQPLTLAPPPPSERLPTTDEYDMMMKIAGTVLKAGGMVPANIRTPEAALAVMLRGKECGMPPLTAMQRVFIVNGRTELETQALMGLVRAYDPTAEFVFHKYSHDGADVELFRNGKSQIRVDYGPFERALSKQGMRPKRDYTRELTGRNGKYNPIVKVNGVTQWEEDPESPWVKFDRDMYAYNAVKRCCRLGAPDCINQIAGPAGYVGVQGYRLEINEEARAPGDEPDAPRNELQKALASGEVQPEAVLSDGASETDDPDHDDAIHNSRTAEPEVKPLDPADPRMIQRIYDLLVDAKSTWDASSYGNMYRALSAKYAPDMGPNDKFPQAIKLATVASACLAELRTLRGDPPAEEETRMTTETRPDHDHTQSATPVQDAPAQEPPTTPDDEGEEGDDEEGEDGEEGEA